MTQEGNPTYDTLYVKFERRKGVFNCPLCEILDGDYKRAYVLEVAGVTKTYQKGLLKMLIQKKMDTGKIIDFCIQRKGTPRDEEVQEFLTKYHV